jgi:hypothetical protein
VLVAMRDGSWTRSASATLGGSTSRPITAVGPSMLPQHHARRRCVDTMGECPRIIKRTMLTADRLRAGRKQCELGDTTVDDHGGLEVPRQLEAGKGQDVRALPCH